jgi:hypothetical protein
MPSPLRITGNFKVLPSTETDITGDLNFSSVTIEFIVFFSLSLRFKYAKVTPTENEIHMIYIR